jgi:riboflavin kinase, archaea type
MELYSDEYAAATGVRLYPGSLNILLEDPWALPDETLQVSEEHVGRLVHLVPCLFIGRGCFLFRTDNAERIGGDEHLILEVLSDVQLRSAHGLSDGDIVEVTVAG